MRTSDEGERALREESHRPIEGEDPAREAIVDELVNQPARPLTDEEEEAAEHDPGRSERVYAPASARVPKNPAPGDDKLVERSARP
jgi:hypothetical protein